MIRFARILAFMVAGIVIGYFSRLPAFASLTIGILFGVFAMAAPKRAR